MTGTSCHAELPRRQQPAVARNDAILAVDQDRVRPAELADGSSDLGDLGIRVRAGIVGEGDERRDRAVFDGQVCA